MKEPIRLRDSSSGASDGVRELLAVARKTRPMTEVERARMLTHGAKLAALSTGGLLSSPAWAGAGKIIAAVLVVGAGAKALPQLFASPDEKTQESTHVVGAMAVPANSSGPVVPEIVPVAPLVSVQKPLEKEPPTTPSSSKAPPKRAQPIPAAKAASSMEINEKPAREDTGDELSREARQLMEVGRFVSTNPNRALELLDAHRLAFPKGKLGIEREVLVIDALAHAGRVQEARTRGETLLLRAKGSLYEVRVQRMLERIKQ